ncbi:VOC family protein [Pontivivens insulae]|uniref:VOC domain-containing protein n=1 Tax=Pontivivens insulae TaxID=1639689 RepID=A0A2R8AFG3_9RHOB|nr:VOC family protein [Pontivivens insulae]RED12160.1 putative glyoxalase superfamily protein PhnB [Pontivivens insulae]SPF30916.1 hypothetical protein POI8812_03261 [Pontivivens insulae]
MTSTTPSLPMHDARPDWQAAHRARVSPFIVVPNAMRVVEFAQEVFDARLARPPLYRTDGHLWNAEIVIGDSCILLGDARDEKMTRPAFLYVHVPDADATYAKAEAAGGKVVMPVTDQFYGDRDGGIEDPAGNLWWISTHIEDPTDDEIVARARAVEASW